MSPRRELSAASTIGDVCAVVESLEQQLSNKELMDAERRKVDDARHAEVMGGQQRLSSKQDEVLTRVDGHGLRTTALETQWRAFFSDEGAFRMVMAASTAQGKKIDNLSWFMAIGVGVLAALQFILPLVLKK